MIEKKVKQKCGRKPAHPQLLRIQGNYKLPRWIVQWLREQDASQSKLIETALLKQYKLTAPRVKIRERERTTSKT